MSLGQVTSQIAEFSGGVIVPGDPSYDETRRVWNGMHDGRPAVIARCRDVDDVVAAVRYGTEHGLPIAVRCGGHSMSGYSTCDDGIVIDLREMNYVEVDAAARRATVQGGALLGDVDRATQPHGLVVPAGVVSHTGAGGLILGGGIGRLMRRYGLTIDSLLSAEVVTADGRILRASATEHPDLFWGIRGGGGNFGIVTSFEFTLHEVARLAVLWTFHRAAEAPGVLAMAARAMAHSDCPDEIYWASFLRQGKEAPWVPVPQDAMNEPGLLSQIEWSGDLEEGRQVLRDIQADLAPHVSELETVEFGDIQTRLDVPFDHGTRVYLKSGFVDELTPVAIDVVCAANSRAPTTRSMIELLPLGGAVSRVASDATAFPNRDAAWLITITAVFEDGDDVQAGIDWARRAYTDLKPHLSAGRYINFMSADDSGASTDAFGDTWDRLRRVKAAYDPGNVFRRNQNIAPSVESRP